MRNVAVLVVAFCSVLIGTSQSNAQQLLESYRAFLSERDHFNSSGERLTTAAAIIRQDRANYHRFGLRDPGDESDSFFANTSNRAALERMLEHGRAQPGVISQIVNETPLVRVEVWRENAGPFVVVTIIEPHNANYYADSNRSNTSQAPNMPGVIYTPKSGSPERTAIMDAVRIAQRTSVKFKVNYLSIFRNGNVSIAIADLQDAAANEPYGGFIFLEAINGRWRALYALNMDGSESCKETVQISAEIIAKAKSLNAPQSFFPESFLIGYDNVSSELSKEGDQSDCPTTARY